MLFIGKLLSIELIIRLKNEVNTFYIAAIYHLVYPKNFKFSGFVVDVVIVIFLSWNIYLWITKLHNIHRSLEKRSFLSLDPNCSLNVGYVTGIVLGSWVTRVASGSLLLTLLLKFWLYNLHLFIFNSNGESLYLFLLWSSFLVAFFLNLIFFSRYWYI